MDTVNFGEHVTIDGYGGDPSMLESKEIILNVLEDLPLKLGMKILLAPIIAEAPGNGGKDPGGWSGIVMIEESHISVHTFPKRKFVSADVYSCKNGMDVNQITKYFTDAFKLQDVETNFIKRGTRYPAANLI